MRKSDIIMTSSVELFDHINHYIHERNIEWMKVMTYGMWAGILPNGYDTDYCTNIKSILDHFNQPDKNATFLISYPRNHEEKLECIKATARRYPHITFGLITNSHAKLYLFSDWSFIIGGCNVSESTWTDFTIHISEERDVFRSFHSIFTETAQEMETIL